MVEHFTLKEFEASLPKHQPLGIVAGEYCYLIPVTDRAGILIRSSIDSLGVSGDTGEDSIRIYPTEVMQLLTTAGNRFGYAMQQGNPEMKWITRQAGWQDRLQYAITWLSKRIKDAGNCKECDKPLRILKVKKEGANKGRWFATCEREHNQFKWLD